jgi:hypothetical protein
MGTQPAAAPPPPPEALPLEQVRLNPPSRWWHFNYWTWLALALCVPVLVVPYYLQKHKHHPPVGTYIAIMGLLAAAVTFRKEPPKIEKAVWIILLTTVMYAEVRNLYVADGEQAEIFDGISHRLQETKTGLDQTVENLSTVGESLKAISANLDKTAVSSQKAADTATEAVKVMTGGDSWGLVDVMPLKILNDDPKKPLFAISNQDKKYTLRDIHLVVTNTTLFVGRGLAVQFCSVGDVLPAIPVPLSSCAIPVDPAIHNDIFITINGNNGSVQESLGMDYRDGRWETSGVVRKGKPDGTSEELKRFGAKQP